MRGKLLLSGAPQGRRRATPATLWSAAQEQLARARELSDAEATVARIDAMAAQVLLGAARRDDAEAAARRALAVAERLDLAESACLALEVLGRIARTRDLREAEAAFARQLRIASTHGLALWVVRADHELGGVDLMAGTGRDRLLKARDLAAEAGALSITATVDLQLSASYWIEFDVPASLAAAQRCQRAARRWNHQLLLAEALVMEARAHATAGHRAAMERAIREAAALERFGPEVQGSAWAARGLYALLRRTVPEPLSPTTRPSRSDSARRAYTSGRTRPSGRCFEPSRTTAATRHGSGSVRSCRSGACWRRPNSSTAMRVALGRHGLRDDAEVSFTKARADLRAGVGLEPQRHLTERLVAECALADGWGRTGRVAWRGGSVLPRHRPGQRRACLPVTAAQGGCPAAPARARPPSRTARTGRPRDHRPRGRRAGVGGPGADEQGNRGAAVHLDTHGR